MNELDSIQKEIFKISNKIESLKNKKFKAILVGKSSAKINREILRAQFRKANLEKLLKEIKEEENRRI